MTTSEQIDSTPVGLSTRAAKRIMQIVASEPQTPILRVSVDGGGCSGFQYGFNLVSETESDDLVIKRDGATVVVDPISLQFLGGSEIDFIDDLIGAHFTVQNPNATASCGCGTSFSI